MGSTIEVSILVWRIYCRCIGHRATQHDIMFSANNSGRGGSTAPAKLWVSVQRCRTHVRQWTLLARSRIQTLANTSAVFVHSFDQCNINRLPSVSRAINAVSQHIHMINWSLTLNNLRSPAALSVVINGVIHWCARSLINTSNSASRSTGPAQSTWIKQQRSCYLGLPTPTNFPELLLVTTGGLFYMPSIIKWRVTKQYN